MANAKFNQSLPTNEPIKSYAPGTPEEQSEAIKDLLMNLPADMFTEQ